MAEAIDPGGWVCPRPLRDRDRIVLGHGGGGLLTGELIEHLFLPAFGPAAAAATPTDSAVLDLGAGGRVAFTTDSYVVRPLFFPGGDIGDLAVNGTVNDLAMSGAVPIALSTAFVLEEGLGDAGVAGAHTDGLEEANRNLASPAYHLREKFQKFFQRAIASRQTESITYVDSGQYMRLNLRVNMLFRDSGFY